jgi:ATP-binding cassette subfamily C (CFTR/MRP) protein 1
MDGTTLRVNLDPHQSVAGDADIIKALGKVHLWDQIRAKGGLEAEFASTDWSVGQKQLLCLARAMVEPS